MTDDTPNEQIWPDLDELMQNESVMKHFLDLVAPRVRGMVRKYVNGLDSEQSQAQEEITQEALRSLLQSYKSDSLKDPKKYAHFFMATAHKQALKWHRKNKKIDGGSSVDSVGIDRRWSLPIREREFAKAMRGSLRALHEALVTQMGLPLKVGADPFVQLAMLPLFLRKELGSQRDVFKDHFSLSAVQMTRNQDALLHLIQEHCFGEFDSIMRGSDEVQLAMESMEQQWESLLLGCPDLGLYRKRCLPQNFTRLNEYVAWHAQRGFCWEEVHSPE